MVFVCGPNKLYEEAGGEEERRTMCVYIGINACERSETDRERRK